MAYERKRMLIWGMTYPELSTKYKETVCSGAVLLDEPRMVRIYPLDTRYIPDANRPSKWDIISAEIERNTADPRPESHRIRAGSIQIERHIDTGDAWRERTRWMIRDEFLVRGYEDMVAQQAQTGRTLGIVSAATIEKIEVDRVPKSDYEAAREKYKQIEEQQDIWEPGRKMMPPLQHRPYITFRGEGDTRTHRISVWDWETHQLLSRSLQGVSLEPGKANFQMALRKIAFNDQKDWKLILGNVATHPHTFVIVGIYYPPKTQQTGLF